MSIDTNLRTSMPVVARPDGTAAVTVTPNSSVPWLLTQVSAGVPDAPSGASGVARVNGVFLTWFIATGDVLAGDPPLLLNPGDNLALTWDGLTPGQAGTVLVFYDRQPWGG